MTKPRSHPIDQSPPRVTPAILHILLSLYRQPMHGYAIMTEVERLSDGEFRLGAGTLYRSLQKLVLDELIVETEADDAQAPADERRRYYALTGRGRAVLQAEVRRLKRLVRSARSRGVIK